MLLFTQTRNAHMLTVFGGEQIAGARQNLNGISKGSAAKWDWGKGDGRHTVKTHLLAAARHADAAFWKKKKDLLL